MPFAPRLPFPLVPPASSNPKQFDSSSCQMVRSHAASTAAHPSKTDRQTDPMSRCQVCHLANGAAAAAPDHDPTQIRADPGVAPIPCTPTALTGALHELPFGVTTLCCRSCRNSKSAQDRLLFLLHCLMLQVLHVIVHCICLFTACLHIRLHHMSTRP